MHDIKYIRENFETFKKKISKRNNTSNLDNILNLDKKNRLLIQKKEELEKENASLWKNIHKKRERIKKGSGEKMRKKGEKGAPTPEQLKKAKSKSSKKKSPFNDSDYAGY